MPTNCRRPVVVSALTLFAALASCRFCQAADTEESKAARWLGGQQAPADSGLEKSGVIVLKGTGDLDVWMTPTDRFPNSIEICVDGKEPVILEAQKHTDLLHNSCKLHVEKYATVFFLTEATLSFTAAGRADLYCNGKQAVAENKGRILGQFHIYGSHGYEQLLFCSPNNEGNVFRAYGKWLFVDARDNSRVYARDCQRVSAREDSCMYASHCTHATADENARLYLLEPQEYARVAAHRSAVVYVEDPGKDIDWQKTDDAAIELLAKEMVKEAPEESADKSPVKSPDKSPVK